MRSILAIFGFMVCTAIHATHIVGGEMLYDFLGKNAQGEDRYRVTLRIYRDCLNGQAQFDGISTSPALLTIRATSGELIGVLDIGKPVVVNIPRTINSNCIQAPTDVCLEEGTYTYTIALLPRAGGYYLIYQRCCRNNTIANLIAPGDQGSTYFTKIPGPEEAAENS